MYAIFRLSPYGAPKIRAVKKEQKQYHFQQNTKGKEIALSYFRGQMQS